MLLSLNRFQAGGLHLLGSAFIVGLAALMVFVIWYPGLLAYASGVGEIFLILAGVDVVLGPLITFIIFNPQKKELRRDLSAVVVIQLIALCYGAFVMYTARPAFLVFNADRIEVVYSNELSNEKLQELPGSFNLSVFSGPIIVGAQMPSDVTLASEIVINAIQGGEDIQHIPKYYVPYADILEKVKEKLRPLSELEKYNKPTQIQADNTIKHYLSTSDNFGYLPLIAKTNNLTVVVEKQTGKIVEMSKLQPFNMSFGTNLINLKKILKKNK